MNHEEAVRQWADEAHALAMAEWKREKRERWRRLATATLYLIANSALWVGAIIKYGLGEYGAASTLMLFVIAGVLFDIERKPHA